MIKIAILIPAAGKSSRMRGGDKLLESVDGQPLLARQAAIACATDAPVLVTLPTGNPARRAVLANGVQIIELADASEGIAASIRAGAIWASENNADGLMILLADLPELETSDLTHMIDAFSAAPDKVLRATDKDDLAGHPTIFPKRLFDRLCALQGDTGARDILKSEGFTGIALLGHRATTDLDTPEAWVEWRSKSGR